MRTIAERLRWARQSASPLSQRKLADIADIADRLVGLIEADTENRRNFEMRTIQGLATALGVSLDWLVNGDEPTPLPSDIKAAVARGQLRLESRKKKAKRKPKRAA